MTSPRMEDGRKSSGDDEATETRDSSDGSDAIIAGSASAEE